MFKNLDPLFKDFAASSQELLYFAKNKTQDLIEFLVSQVKNPKVIKFAMILGGFSRSLHQNYWVSSADIERANLGLRHTYSSK